MNYRLINHTKISRKTINKLIQFACPKGVKNFVVSVMYDRRGAAFWGHASIFSRPRKVQIYIANDNEYPLISNNRNIKKAGYNPIFFIRNNREAILSLLAHELRHLWQGHVSKREFWDGKICKYVHWDGKSYASVYKMEKDACEYTKKVLLKYRKLQRK